MREKTEQGERNMTGEERRKEISRLLGEKPLAAAKIAQMFGVSRQVVVQDVALLRAEGKDILSTNRGYVLPGKKVCSRTFKVRHSDGETREELCLITDRGGCVENVFVHHKVYGTITAPMGIDSRSKADAFMADIARGKSDFLKNITSDYHYHTVTAESEEVLDGIEAELARRGFLIPRNGEN